METRYAVLVRGYETMVINYLVGTDYLYGYGSWNSIGTFDTFAEASASASTWEYAYTLFNGRVTFKEA